MSNLLLLILVLNMLSAMCIIIPTNVKADTFVNYENLMFNGTANITAYSLPTFISYVNLAFGGTAIVHIPTFTSYATLSFGGKTTINYYDWGNWSDYWMFHFVNFGIPTNFTATNYNDTIINLSWTKDVNATHTIIMTKTTGYPNSTTDGTLIVNTTDSTYSIPSLTPGTRYYFSAFAYNSTQNIELLNYATANNYTKPGSPSSLAMTNTTLAEITLSWTKGTNATNTVLVMNSTGVASFPTTPDGGIKIYNNTGSSATASSLSFSTTYYFRIWSYNPDSGFYSPSYSSLSQSTSSPADTPTNFTAITGNATIINLSWTPGTNATITLLKRNTGTYPTLTTGTTLYNGSETSYSDTGLTQATHYYYTVWGWSGGAFSAYNATSHNVTLPQPITNFIGNVSGNTLFINWTMGTGSTRTILANSTTSYPTNPQGTNVFFNNTNTSTNTTITGVNYYSGWAYALVDGISVYSERTTLLWGGLEVWCYNETNGLPIPFNLFVTNAEHTQSIEVLNCTNPNRIDVKNVPHGEGTVIQTSSTGYNTRVYTVDLYENQWFILKAYLPPQVYIPPGGTTPGGATQSVIYYIRVVELWNTGFTTSDIAVTDAKVTIRRYINSTGQYETVSSMMSDANGYVNLYALPNTLYQILIEKDGYVTSYTDWLTVPPNAYGQTTEKDVRITRETIPTPPSEEQVLDNITFTVEPRTGVQYGAYTVWFNITSSDCKLEWFSMNILYENQTTNLMDNLSYQISIDPCGGTLSFTIPNVTGKYHIICIFKKTGFDAYEVTQDGSIITFILALKKGLSSIPDEVYFIVLIIISAIAMGYVMLHYGTGVGTGFIGIGILTIGMLLHSVMIKIGVDSNNNPILISGWAILGIVFIIYTIGVFLWSRL